jgi:hypothetical protein
MVMNSLSYIPSIKLTQLLQIEPVDVNLLARHGVWLLGAETSASFRRSTSL